MLKAEDAVVGFHGREQELADLTAWRDIGGPQSARRLYGLGGQGKTRLADHFRTASETAGWRAVILRQSDRGAVPPTGLFGAVGLLVTVDYADRLGTDEIERLAASPVLARNTPVGLLILAGRTCCGDRRGLHSPTTVSPPPRPR